MISLLSNFRLTPLHQNPVRRFRGTLIFIGFKYAFCYGDGPKGGFLIVLVTYYYIITIDGKTVNVSLQVVCSLLNFAFNPPIIELIIIRIIESIHITNIFLMSLFSIKVDMLFFVLLLCSNSSFSLYVVRWLWNRGETKSSNMNRVKTKGLR